MKTHWKITATASAMALVALTACIDTSPVYHTEDIYIPPAQASACLADCGDKKVACARRCDERYQDCALRAQDQAASGFEDKVKIYKLNLDTYLTELDMYNSHYRDYEKKKWQIDRQLQPVRDACDKRDALACTKKDELEKLLDSLKDEYFGFEGIIRNKPDRPHEPSMEEEIKLISERSCASDCGCDSLFKSCYVACGGTIEIHRICVRHCEKGK